MFVGRFILSMFEQAKCRLDKTMRSASEMANDLLSAKKPGTPTVRIGYVRYIIKSVQYCMENVGVGKPYIFSTSNCIFKGMPPVSYQIMHKEYRRIITEQ